MESPITKYMKFRFIIFSLFIISLGMVVTGPFLYTDTYYRICQVIVLYYAVKFAIMSMIQAYSYFRFRKTMDNVLSAEPENLSLTSSVTHVFVIPNFK